jgi:hypothetical protein
MSGQAAGSCPRSRRGVAQPATRATDEVGWISMTNEGWLACAPSWARRARAKPAPETPDCKKRPPDDFSRTVGHVTGTGTRAISIQGHALV